MTTPLRSDEPNSRRRFLSLVGAAGLTAMAGCTGGAGEPAGDGGPGGDGSGAGGGADGGSAGSGAGDGSGATGCGDIPGAPTAFDPGPRSVPFLFEYPDTFEEYNTQTNETESLVGAQFGHTASAETASYPVNVSIHQSKTVITDEETATNWVTSMGASDALDPALTVDGATVEAYESTAFEDPESGVWRLLVPAREEGRYNVTVRFQDLRSEGACLDVVASVAREMVESMTHNPSWDGPVTG